MLTLQAGLCLSLLLQGLYEVQDLTYAAPQRRTGSGKLAARCHLFPCCLCLEQAFLGAMTGGA